MELTPNVRLSQGVPQRGQAATRIQQHAERVRISGGGKLQGEPEALWPGARRFGFEPVAQGVHLPDPDPVFVYVLEVPGCELRLGHRVPHLGEPTGIIEVRSCDVAQALNVHQAKRHPAAVRRIRARPRVADRHDPRRHRLTTRAEPPVAVRYPAHRDEVGDRVTIQPVLMPRACRDQRRPEVGIAQALEWGVAGSDGHHDRPRVVVTRNSEQREGPNRSDGWSAELRHLTRPDHESSACSRRSLNPRPPHESVVHPLA